MTTWEYVRQIAYMLLIDAALLLIIGFTFLPSLYWSLPSPFGDIVGGLIGLAICVVGSIGSRVLEWAHGERRYRRDHRHAKPPRFT
jgi:hypothetical protein